jgi:L-lactate transport
MWQQNYTPVAQSLGWSALVAAVPFFVLLYMLAIKRKPSWISAISSLVSAILIALFVYKMPFANTISASFYGAAFGLLPTGWITFNAIFIYRLTLETGQFETIKGSLAQLTSDQRLQALLIAFAFGAFIEGAAGSGVPVAIAAAMLVGMGFKKLHAAGLCLLANTAPVAFGAIGLPVIILGITTGLPISNLSASVGRISAPLSLVIPAYMTILVAGWKGFRGALPAVIICGVSFAAVQLLVSNFIGPQLTDIIAAIFTMSVLIMLLKVWKPGDSYISETNSTYSNVKYHASKVWLAWIPYALLALFVLIWGIPYIRIILGKSDVFITWPWLNNQVLRIPPIVNSAAPYSAVYDFNWLASPGTACFLAAVLASAVAGMSIKRFIDVFKSTAKLMFLPTVTIVSVLSLAFLMNYCGAIATLGLAFAATGILFPFFSPLLGWMGVFLTGSDTSCNALFGNLQVITAHSLNLNPVLTAAANSSGGVMGKMISVQSIAVAAAATGMPSSEEPKLFRFTFWHSVLLACGIGILVTIYAYVIPWIIH